MNRDRIERSPVGDNFLWEAAPHGPDEKFWRLLVECTSWRHSGRIEWLPTWIPTGEIFRDILSYKIAGAVQRMWWPDAHERSLNRSRSGFRHGSAIDRPSAASVSAFKRITDYTRAKLGKVWRMANFWRNRNRGGRLWIPYPSPRLQASIAALAANRNVALFSSFWGAREKGRYYFNIAPIQRCSQRERRIVEDLASRQLAELDQRGVSLNGGEKADLTLQMLDYLKGLRHSYFELCALRPEAVFVHGDNHAPHQWPVLQARELGIPVIMLQHGLDCEHYVLDDAYADVICVWGTARAGRYKAMSAREPRKIVVTGNPEFERFPRKVQKLRSFRNCVLWLTRPHGRDKIRNPTRWPDEGVTILGWLANAISAGVLSQVTIKPHPYDTIGAYRAIIAQEGLEEKIKITNESLHTLLETHDVIIGEDSTAVVEALAAGCAVIHAYAGTGDPTLCMAARGIAKFAGSCDDLYAALVELEDVAAFLEQTGVVRREYVQEQLGDLDGESTKRVTNVVCDELRARV